jgi:tetratricopeptide (TPR) repeat protein
LSRLYVATGQYDKAIPILTTLVNEQPGWQDGPVLLAEAYSAAGRTAEARKEAAETYDRALARAPRNSELRARYASALINAGGRENLTKARGILNDLIAARPNDSARILYLLSQTERRLGDSKAAEATARRVIAQNAQSPWGYYALAEALESRRDYQAVVDELGPVVASHAAKAPDGSFDVGLLLPHLGFAYQELGRTDQAIATFEQARKLSPDDPAAASYLAEANIAAKRYDAALSVTRSALADNPDDQRLIRLEAQALRYTGKPAEAAARLKEALEKHDDDPTAYIALAQMYTETERGADAIKLLEDARQKFPDDNSILFEVGATFDRLKRFPDAEAAFKQLIARDPQNAAALNYLGYMLAERGERLDESVDYVKRALELDPDNGSFLDSLGWAYYKAEKLDLAEGNLRRAADQMKTNSVIQDHYGDVLLKLGRYADAIAAFNRALSGDGDSIDRAGIGKKIQAARQKLKK